MSLRNPLEAHTRSQIDRRLFNLDWVLDQKNPRCNVFQEQAKTDEQNRKFKGGRPDYVLYEAGTNIPLGVIEAKKPGENLDRALDDAVEKYARPINAPLAFAYNDTFVIARHVTQNRPLKIDGEEIQDFINHSTAVRFAQDGAEILFMPYTPTKTNILYFKKGVPKFKTTYFFVVHNDGFELGTKRKPIPGESDLKKLLSEIEKPRDLKAQARVVPRTEIEQTGNWNMRPFYYMEDVPEISGQTAQLNDGVIVEINDFVDPATKPDDDWSTLEVSQNGIFLADTFKGAEATQSYKQVKAGDMVYNPHRVNIGSIGVVPDYLDGGLVSPIYIVFRSKSERYPPSFIVSVLKQPRYLRVIMNYSVSSARASLPFSELTRIKIPQPTDEDSKMLKKLEHELNEQRSRANEVSNKIETFSTRRLKGADANPRHLEDFKAVLARAVPSVTKGR